MGKINLNSIRKWEIAVADKQWIQLVT